MGFLERDMIHKMKNKFTKTEPMKWSIPNKLVQNKKVFQRSRRAPKQKSKTKYLQDLSGNSVLLSPIERFSVEDDICTIASFGTINTAFSA